MRFLAIVVWGGFHVSWMCKAQAQDAFCSHFDPIIDDCMGRHGLDRQACDSCISSFTQGVPNCAPDALTVGLGSATCHALANCTCASACKAPYMDKVNCITTGPLNGANWCSTYCGWCSAPYEALVQCLNNNGLNASEQQSCHDCIADFGYFGANFSYSCAEFNAAECKAIENCTCVTPCKQEFLNLLNCDYDGYCNTTFTCPQASNTTTNTTTPNPLPPQPQVQAMPREEKIQPSGASGLAFLHFTFACILLSFMV